MLANELAIRTQVDVGDDAILGVFNHSQFFERATAIIAPGKPIWRAQTDGLGTSSSCLSCLCGRPIIQSCQGRSAEAATAQIKPIGIVWGRRTAPMD